MNWNEAVEAMRKGHIVARDSKKINKRIVGVGSMPIYDLGEEGCFLAVAWSDDESPVRVFMGAMSKVLFVPDSDHRSATDWKIME